MHLGQESGRQLQEFYNACSIGLLNRPLEERLLLGLLSHEPCKLGAPLAQREIVPLSVRQTYDHRPP